MDSWIRLVIYVIMRYNYGVINLDWADSVYESHKTWMSCERVLSACVG